MPSPLAVQIDRPALERAVADYLRSPEAEPIYQNAGPSWPACLAITLGAGFLGAALLPTIVLALPGLKLLRFAASLRVFRAGGPKLPKDPDRLRPLIAHGIIIGPSGHGLLLGTFDAAAGSDLAALARLANRLGRIYTEGPSAREEKAMAKILRDDTYRAGRRRPVPEPYAEGRPLYLFDAELDIEHAAPGPEESVLIACVAPPGDRGAIAQIPWDVVAPAVRI